MSWGFIGPYRSLEILYVFWLTEPHRGRTSRWHKKLCETTTERFSRKVILELQEFCKPRYRIQFLIEKKTCCDCIIGGSWTNHNQEALVPYIFIHDVFRLKMRCIKWYKLGENTFQSYDKRHF